RQVRQVAPRERLLALGASRFHDLPPDRPAVAMGVEAARVLLGVHDVGGNAAVEVRLAGTPEDFLKGGGEAAKVLENLRAVNQVGHRSPRMHLARPAEQQESNQAE